MKLTVLNQEPFFVSKKFSNKSPFNSENSLILQRGKSCTTSSL